MFAHVGVCMYMELQKLKTVVAMKISETYL